MRKGLICGSPRSATTLLAQMLNKHPDVVATSELGIFFACHRDMDGWMLRQKLCHTRRTGIDETGLWKKVKFEIPEEITTKNVLARIEVPVFVDKYPLYTLNLAYSTRYTDFAMCCIRDPREVMESQIRRWREAKKESMSDEQIRLDIPWARPDVEAALTWKPTWWDYTECWEKWKAKTEQQWLEVKYWELPGNSSQIASFLGLEQASLDAHFTEDWETRNVVWQERIPEARLPDHWRRYLQSQGCPTV